MGIRASLEFRAYTQSDLRRVEEMASKARKEMYERVREESARQIKEHMDWVVQCAMTFGYKIDDLQLIASSTGLTSNASIVVKKTTQVLGWAEAVWVHDELQVTTSSIYGTEQKDPA
jgi:hypothetical protein